MQTILDYRTAISIRIIQTVFGSRTLDLEECKRPTGPAKTQMGYGRRKTNRLQRVRIRLLLEASAEVGCMHDYLARS